MHYRFYIRLGAGDRAAICDECALGAAGADNNKLPRLNIAARHDVERACAGRGTNAQSTRDRVTPRADSGRARDKKTRRNV